ncbi:anthocyanidin 3-O-glucosyltransferase 5-like [Euphorbia lathyris]|uniref:anthocyanidin 3-O-glucosyltransferase 5-like n=1 Tax=Euphorbia lathyris TaxID=212925 RepID=UPI003313FD2F
MQNARPHAVLLASAGMGHLIPAVELGKRLITHHNFTVTIFVVSTDPSTAKSLLESPYPKLTVSTLPFVDISPLVQPSDDIVTKIIVLMRESMPNLRSAISVMKFRPTALIVDIFGTEAFPIADEFSMLKYVFVTSDARFLALTVYAPAVEKMVEEEHVKQKKPLRLPGCKPVRFEDTMEVYLKMDDRVYDEYTRLAREIPTADGILMNTWEDLDRLTIESLRDPKKLGDVVRVPIYPIGPLARPAEPVVGKGKHVMDWLESQPSESVIYVSFGSGGTLSTRQTIELAWGLELSKQRFIWVFRPPLDHDASGSFFTVSDESEALKRYLPNGFLTRIQEVGLVVPTWAPQSEILAHPSVGGFLTHCGWNSTLESITNGVPMITWPLYAEQKMNATLLAEDLKVAVRSEKQPTESVIGREEIAMMVRKIMEDEEGESMRIKVKELKNSGENALKKGGSSYNSLSQVVEECEYSLRCLTAKARGA